MTKPLTIIIVTPEERARFIAEAEERQSKKLPPRGEEVFLETIRGIKVVTIGYDTLLMTADQVQFKHGLPEYK